jgi:predicted Zn-dependent peptidase
VGSINESAEIRGVSHFVEHMCFKGSRHFSNWTDVNMPFSQSGAYFNASTTKQYTCYTIDCLNGYVHDFLTILGDMMLHSKFDKREYKKELNVVKEETKMRKPDSFVEYLALNGTVYEHWVDHEEYHKPGCLPYDAVVDYYHQYYVPQNIVISIVSSLTFNTIVRFLQKTSFSERQLRKIHTPPVLNVNIGSSLSCNPDFIFIPNGGSTTRIEIGVRVCDQNNTEDANRLNVLRHILSATMSSRLFVELREKRGLTYRSGSYMNLYEMAGVFIIYAITDTERLIHDNGNTTNKNAGKNRGVLPVLFSILDDLIKQGVTEQELKMAKQNIRDTLKMEQIASGDKASYNGIRVMLHNDTNILPNSDIYEKHYKHITKTDINAVIRTYFAPKLYYLSLNGGKLPKPDKIIEFLV